MDLWMLHGLRALMGWVERSSRTEQPRHQGKTHAKKARHVVVGGGHGVALNMVALGVFI